MPDRPTAWSPSPAVVVFQKITNHNNENNSKRQNNIYPYCDWEITINDDTDGKTGGYYVYISDNKSHLFDYWFENKKELENQIDDFEIICEK